MIGDRENGFTLPNDRAIAQFAPNFTVYLLPPDVVCLYSEDRKFLLHGELYCALAARSARAERAFARSSASWNRIFRPSKIREALKRLIERRYILRASRASTGTQRPIGRASAFRRRQRRKISRNCRVRIQAIDVDGAAELEAALKELGVRVVKRSPDMTVTLVSDYLEGQLAEVNRRHLAEGTPWLLVQPSGIFPLVGPVLSPGNGACWTCLAERMKRNREIKALLDRRQAHCIAVSPLAQHAFGQSAIQLAALEIAKAIASDFRTDLNDHIVSLDLWARPS